MQDLDERICLLSQEVAKEINTIKQYLNGPMLFEHMSKSLDEPLSLIDIFYTRKAGDYYYKNFVLKLLWRGQEYRKNIVLYTAIKYEEDNVDVFDELYNQYNPYLCTITALNKENGLYDIVICRKAYPKPQTQDG